MTDYTRWWQYIIILTVVGFVIFLVFQTYFVYVPIERIESQVYFTTDLLNEAAESADRLEKKIDATLTILEPLILPVAITLCNLICVDMIPGSTCPTATRVYCESILPTGMTGPSVSPAIDALLERGLSELTPVGPTGTVSKTMSYYMRNRGR